MPRQPNPFDNPPTQNQETRSVRVVLPVLPILTMLFVTLKLTGHIAWSWWWVLSPTLIPLGLGLGMLLLALIIALLS